ncbi:hypothetical protein AVEN_131527-1 [Araneus ventricosus]|uniref:Uncharacterized protein n=1 Tax=Araneus ventricosus TaxID=182803 RepID=A0A4Y2NYC4_ARAVE|nr:hypothetical protein AVEN_131527-1 [Araneus ventricosus]
MNARLLRGLPNYITGGQDCYGGLNISLFVLPYNHLSSPKGSLQTIRRRQWCCQLILRRTSDSLGEHIIFNPYLWEVFIIYQYLKSMTCYCIILGDLVHFKICFNWGVHVYLGERMVICYAAVIWG